MIAKGTVGAHWWKAGGEWYCPPCARLPVDSVDTKDLGVWTAPPMDIDQLRRIAVALESILAHLQEAWPVS